MHRVTHVRDDLMPSVEIDFRQLTWQKLRHDAFGCRVARQTQDRRTSADLKVGPTTEAPPLR